MKLNLNKPVYPFLLVIFFFLHVLLENYNPSLLRTAGWLILVYSIATFVLFILFKLLLKDWRKAALPVFGIMGFNFFFGSGNDWLRKSFGNTFITKMSVILAITLLLLILLFVYLKRTDRKLFRVTQYLNLLFLLLILVDGSLLLMKGLKGRKATVTDLRNSFSKCDSCARPDIYLVIADEYAGKTQLKDLFAFDNSAFENDLQSRGFHILSHSVSNYNATVYSMASILNMDYLHNLHQPSIVNHKDILLCYDLIKNNNLSSFFIKNGYTVNSYSFFDVADKDKVITNYFFPSNTLLLTGQTFIRRFLRNAGSRLVSKEKLFAIKKNDQYNDIKIDSLTRKEVLAKTSQPKFIYTHLDMPHHPYFYDSSGKEIPIEKLTDAYSMDRQAYIQYLQYCNQKLLSLVDFIKTNSPQPPVIILMSDHGFRQLAADVNRDYYFMNLDAVSFPNNDYSRFYDSMSSVNQFRVTLNTLFRQQLPLLKDSTSFLVE